MFVRGVETINSPSVLLDIDFSLGFAPETHTGMIMNGAPGEITSVGARWLTDRGTPVILGGGPSTFYTVPAGAMSGNDVQFIYASGSVNGVYRSTTIYGKSFTDHAFTLPDPIGHADVALTGQSFGVTIPAESTAVVYLLSALQSGSSGMPPYLNNHVLITRSWLGSASMITIATPDLTSLPDWQTSWSFVSGVNLGWDVDYASNNHGTGDFLPTTSSTNTPASYATRVDHMSGTTGNLVP
jgi:hypothetical protein